MAVRFRPDEHDQKRKRLSASPSPSPELWQDRLSRSIAQDACSYAGAEQRRLATRLSFSTGQLRRRMLLNDRPSMVSAPTVGEAMSFSCTPTSCHHSARAV